MIVRFFDWEQPKNVYNSIKDLKPGDQVVADHVWGGLFIAKVLVVEKNIENEESAGTVLRKATAQDFQIVLGNKDKERKFLIEVKRESRKLELPMKIVEVNFDLSGSCYVVSFIAEGRIDFRELVRTLSTQHQKTVRFQQIGSRDECRRLGGYGCCGRELCCKKFPGILKSISTDMARCQLISHRGLERLSGVCGRLMCCLAFEAEQYEEMIKDLPQKGDQIDRDGIRGRVIEINALNRNVRVEKDDGTMVVIKWDEKNKK